MVALSLRGSRVGLAFVVLLIGVLAVANCNTYVYNNSPFYVQLSDVTSNLEYGPFGPNTEYQLPWGPLPDGTLPENREFFLVYYTVAPSNTSSLSGTKVLFAVTPVYFNASITFFLPANKQTNAGQIGFTLSYR